MPTSSSSGPEDRGNHDALSAWEQRVLSDIEHGLAEGDPRLARKMTGAGSKAALRWWPLSARSTALLLVVFVVLAAAGALLPASWWAALGLVTTLTVVPWLLLAASERNGAH